MSYCQDYFGGLFMDFSTRIKELRKSRGINQTTLGIAIGVTLKQIQRYEREDCEPTLSKLLALADYFDVSLDYLVGRSEIAERR